MEKTMSEHTERIEKMIASLKELSPPTEAAKERDDANQVQWLRPTTGA